MFYIHDRLLPNSWSDIYCEKVIVATCHGEQPLDIVTHDNSGETTVSVVGMIVGQRSPMWQNPMKMFAFLKGGRVW